MSTQELDLSSAGIVHCIEVQLWLHLRLRLRGVWYAGKAKGASRDCYCLHVTRGCCFLVILVML